MRSVGSRREDIQKRIELLRAERAREQKAYDEILAEGVDMSPADIAEAARRKAIEDEPTSIDVDGATLSVGDYVFTVDDPHTLLAAEKGIFIPDVIKQVYLGERGKVTRVMPSFQGKPAVELCFADGAVKIFLTECLSLGQNNTRKHHQQRKGVPKSVEGKSGHVDPVGLGVPDVAPPPKPVSSPQPTWDSIEIPKRSPDPTASNPHPNVTNTAVPLKTTTAGTMRTTGTATKESPARTKRMVNGDTKISSKNSLSVSERKQTEPILKGNPQGKDVESSQNQALLGSNTNVEKKIGLVKEVLSNQWQGDSGGEQLGSPLKYNEVPTMPLITTGERDNLLETPRVDLMSYSRTKRLSNSVTNPNNGSLRRERGIPTNCPANYRAHFSLNDRSTGISRLSAKAASSDPTRCRVTGFTPNQRDLHFVPFVLRRGTSTFEEILSDVTDTLKWRSMGTNAKRLFKTDGVEITRVNDILDGMSLVATPGQVYTPDPANKKKSTAATGVKTPAPTVLAESTPLMEFKNNRCVGGSTAKNASVQNKVGSKQNRRQEQTTPSTKALSSAKVPQPGGVQSAKGISKPISVRVFSNGEYGDRVTDRFPFRTVTLRPIHKTMRAVLNTIERELEWHSMGKKVDRMFDATGVEITSVEELYDGQPLVVSTGERFIIPHPTSVLHEDVIKLSASTNYTPAPTGANAKPM